MIIFQDDQDTVTCSTSLTSYAAEVEESDNTAKNIHGVCIIEYFVHNLCNYTPRNDFSYCKLSVACQQI